VADLQLGQSSEQFWQVPVESSYWPRAHSPAETDVVGASMIPASPKICKSPDSKAELMDAERSSVVTVESATV